MDINHRTVFDTPALSNLLHCLAEFLLKVFGWQVEGQLPDEPKYVLIGAPHTSNWDFAVMLAVAFAFRLKLFWLGKDTLFRWPLGGIARWLGGIPIDRSQPHGVVAQAVQTYRNSAKLVMLIPPEGTRKRTTAWKTGFYYIALGAEVPIVLGFADFRRKVAGLGPVLMPSGDIQADMQLIRAFYINVTGKFPQAAGEITVTPGKSLPTR